MSVLVVSWLVSVSVSGSVSVSVVINPVGSQAWISGLVIEELGCSVIQMLEWIELVRKRDGYQSAMCCYHVEIVLLRVACSQAER